MSGIIEFYCNTVVFYFLWYKKKKTFFYGQYFLVFKSFVLIVEDIVGHADSKMGLAQGGEQINTFQNLLRNTFALFFF